MEALKLVVVLAAIILALRRRISVGITLLAMGPFTALLYQVGFRPLMEGYGSVAGSAQFFSLTGLVVFVTVLGTLMKEIGYLDRLADACRSLPGGSRTAVVSLPPLIGLMPMPGGSLLSAPLVNSVLSDSKYTPHFKCAANYWFRHQVEFAWPIYAGLVLTEAITGLPIGRVALLQMPLTLFMFAIGFVYFALRITNNATGRPELLKPMRGIAVTIWPVMIAIFLYGLFGLELSLSAAAAIIALVVVVRPDRPVLTKALKAGFSVELVVLIFGVLSFQMVLELSGAVQSIPSLAAAWNLPPELIIFLVCFLIGLLTGMVSAYVSLGYTLLAGLLYQPEIVPGHILLAALSGFMGMMVSPAHICLVVTNAYFGSELSRVIRTLAIPLIVLGLLGFLLYLTPYASFFV